MTIAIQVRRATPDDATALAQMRWDDTWENTESAPANDGNFAASFAHFLRQALASNDWVVWVAELEGRLVAHLYLHIVEMVPRPGRFNRQWGYISGVYTIPEARNHGVGSVLLQKVIDSARKEGQQFLLLWPSERSVPFYARAGFAPSPDAVELDLER